MRCLDFTVPEVHVLDDRRRPDAVRLVPRFAFAPWISCVSDVT